MKCIILAAGYATRLYPLTENFPKPLLPVGGKPILGWLVEDIASQVDEFVIISNHKFARHFEDWAAAMPQKITVLDDGTESNETRLGAVRDILFAVERLDIHDDCLVMAGDNVLDFSLQGFIRYAQQVGTSCVMCHEEHDLARQQRTAIITLADETPEGGLITSYEEKPKEPKGHLAVPPFYWYRAGGLDRIPEALEAGCGYDAPGSYAAWLSYRTPMHAWKMPGHRHDIGDMKSYEAVRDSYTGPAIK